jgi:hypothetical protein
MKRITKGEMKVLYDRLKREQRLRITTNIMLLVPVFGIIIWLASCQFPAITQPPEMLPADGTMYFERGNSIELQQEWDEIYDGVYAPHPPRYYGYVPEDDEIFRLRGLLHPHGISVFRINPNDPEHQRRYRRHLEEPDNFHTIVEEDI